MRLPLAGKNRRLRRLILISARTLLVTGLVVNGVMGPELSGLPGDSIFGAPPAQARSVEEITGDINRLNGEVDRLESRIKELEGQIAQKQGEIRSLKNDIAVLEQEIDKLQLQIESTQKKIERTEAEIERTTIEIRTTEEKIKTTKENIVELLRVLADYDKTSLIEVLLSNKSFSDLLNQIQYTETIQKRTQEKLNEVQQLKADLEAQKQLLEEQRHEAILLNEQLKGQQAALEQKRDQKDALLVKTKSDEAKYQELLKDTEALQKQVQEDIKKLEEELAAKAGGSSGAAPAGKGVLLMPADGSVVQEYGMTDYAKGGAYGGAPHNGVDIANSLGTPIWAAEKGSVAATGSLGAVAYGNWVAVSHQSLGLTTVYGHLISSGEVTPGDKVERGDVIARMGSTGYSTGPHVHFMVCTSFQTVQKPYGLLPVCNHVNPMNYL